MKKFVVLFVVLIFVQMTAFAQINDVSYTYEEECEQVLNSGYKCLAYMGELRFSVDENSPDAVGCVVSYLDVYEDCHYADIPFSGDLSSGNFSMRIGGLGFESTDYKIVPYYIKDGERIFGEEKIFSISETCMALASLRVAYDQIQKIEFNENEQEIVNLVLPVVKETIEAGESGEAEINKKYIKKTYPDKIEEVQKLIDAMGSAKYKFLGKLDDGIEKAARTYITSNFA